MAIAAGGVRCCTFPLNMLVGRDWIPPDDQGELTRLLNLPEGTSLDGDDARRRRARGPGGQDRRRSSSSTPTSTKGSRATPTSTSGSSTSASASAATWTWPPTSASSARQVPNLRYKVVIPSALGGGESLFPVRAFVLGPDLARDGRAGQEGGGPHAQGAGPARRGAQRQPQQPRAAGQDRPGQRASDLGVRAADVAGAVRLMIAGEDQISTYKEEDEQYDVTLQLLPEQQKDPERLAPPDDPLVQGRARCGWTTSPRSSAGWARRASSASTGSSRSR